MQDGNVQNTYADTSKLEKFIGFISEVSLREGLKKFVICYKDYFLVKELYFLLENQSKNNPGIAFIMVQTEKTRAILTATDELISRISAK